MLTDRRVIFESLKMTRTKHFIDGRLKKSKSFLPTVPNWQPLHKVDQKTFKSIISGLHFTHTFVGKHSSRVEMIYQIAVQCVVTRVILFLFSWVVWETLWKVGTSWISSMGGILERGVQLEKGGYDLLNGTNYINYCIIIGPPKILRLSPLLKFSSPPNLIFCSAHRQLFSSEIFTSPLKLGGLLHATCIGR